MSNRSVKRLFALSAVGFALALAGPATADEYAGYKPMFQPLPAIAPIPGDNSLTEAKAELGKMLFFEPRISASGVISCATCHNPALGYTDRIPRATGHMGQVGERNTPTVLNSGFFGAQFWDGRAPTLEAQALGPVEAGIEMAMPIDKAVARLKEFEIYHQMFAAAFDEKDPIKPANMAKALAAFQRTLVTPNSPFDRYLAGDDHAMSAQQKRGMKAFADRGCVGCHRGPALTDSNFYPIKVPGSTDLGRYLVTKKDADKHAFKTPTLRNVALTYPYFNNGNVDNLKDAIKVMGKEMLGLDLPAKEVADIEAFLHALTGEVPQFAVPSLP
ncbi:MAG: cytochrome c peroxidase [Chromatiales bacterium]|jgi:cytochrome c peroxidase|nr:cytochrome c peroxidase [Chromatiales bacterium]MDX9768231.1 cytochrome c peroxidase [Ectothiorhodospiraceae bacterium]